MPQKNSDSKQVWVYEGTSIKYTLPFETHQLTDTQLKQGQVVKGKLTLINGSKVSLELIRKGARCRREETIGVDEETRTSYDPPVEIEQLTDTQLVDESQASVELISEQAQRLREEIWVYEGTSISYARPFKIEQLTDPQFMNGRSIIKGRLMSANGSPVSLELVKKHDLRKNKSMPDQNESLMEYSFFSINANNMAETSCKSKKRRQEPDEASIDKTKKNRMSYVDEERNTQQSEERNTQQSEERNTQQSEERMSFSL